MALNNTKLTIEAAATLTKLFGTTTASLPLALKKQYALNDGTGANQANRMYYDQRTLAASATEDLDLAAGVLDAFGASITFVRIKAIVVAAAVGNANNVLVGGAATNQFLNWVSDATDKIVVRPGGVFALFATDATGYPVTATTGDLLRIGNSGAGTSVVYDIILIGSSA